MAERDPLHQPSINASGLEAGIVALDPPLLPYEKDLIEILGCSEEEYRTLLRFAQLHSRTRPAEYEPYSWINNVSATIIAVASLVLGLATTAVSVLLRKHRKFSSPKSVGSANKI